MMRDLLWALRWLRKNPLFAVAVTLILGLGIGANTAVFSVVDAVLLRPLPYESANDLVRVAESNAKRAMDAVPAQDYLFWRGRRELFDKTVPYIKDVVTMTGASEPDQVMALRSSGDLFSLLGVHAQLGRVLVQADDNTSDVAVLSDRLWRRQFHADPRVLGRTVTLSGHIFTIAGVMPPEFDFPDSGVEMWLPLRVTPDMKDWLQVIGRLRKGVTTPQAQAALAASAHQLEQENPKHNAGLKISVMPWRQTVERQYELTLVFILAAVGLVLLIACADVGGLLLSRAVQRQKEIAIRASLGAGFWRVARQLLAESFVLAVFGSLAGIAAAYYTLQFLSKQLLALPIVLPHLQHVGLNSRVLVFNTALCLLLAVLCSLAPVLLASRTDLQGTLRSGHSAAPKSSARLFSILIASEAAFAFLLLVGSGLLVRSLIRLQQADHGFHPDHVLTMRVPIGTRMAGVAGTPYDTKPKQMAFYHELLEQIRRIPGVRAAAVVNNLPLSGFNTSLTMPSPHGETILMAGRTISPEYFSVMGIPLLEGRFFSESDGNGSPPVAIINQSFARQLFPGREAIGQTLPKEGSGPATTVVGVVKDSAQMSYDEPARAEIYIPYQQFIFGAFLSTIVVRTAGDPLALAETLRKAIWAVDPNEPILKVETMNDVIADSIWRPRFSAWLFSMLGGLALLLTSVGIYGVVAYTTSLRAQEVGIRVALGASPADVVGVILRGSMIPLCTGLAISLAAALLLARLLTSLLYEISPADPATYISAGALLLAIGAAASLRPAWKAATGDPLTALRAE